MADIEVGHIESHVRALDGSALLDPQIKRQLMRELMTQVKERDAHQQRLLRERQFNAVRTSEEIA